jgi:hypothetical protein
MKANRHLWTAMPDVMVSLPVSLESYPTATEPFSTASLKGLTAWLWAASKVSHVGIHLNYRLG